MKASDEYFISEALAIASEPCGPDEVPVGAVIVKDGRIIASAANRTERSNDPTAHAEILAIRQAAEKTGDWRLAGCSLYVTLEPCLMCCGAIINARIERLVFGAYSKQEGCCGSVVDVAGFKSVKTEIIGGVLKEQCEKLLSDYFTAKR